MRIAEQVMEYLVHGVAINAVNMPALSEQYRALGPYATLASHRNFAAILRAAIRIRFVCTISARSPITPPACCVTRAWPACWPLDLATANLINDADSRAARLGSSGASR